jgi:hypothetical protein
MTEHWHIIASGVAVPLASSLTIALNWPSGQSGPRAAAAPRQPEAMLEVEFSGLDAHAQQRALGSFPGGRRFALASSPRG